MIIDRPTTAQIYDFSNAKLGALNLVLTETKNSGLVYTDLDVAEGLIDEKKLRTFVANKGQNQTPELGKAFFMNHERTKEAEIVGVSVAGSLLGSQLGRQLIKAAVRHSRKLGATDICGNTDTAWNEWWYTELGFELGYSELGTRQFFAKAEKLPAYDELVIEPNRVATKNLQVALREIQ